MIPSALAVLIYQILALLGASGVAQIVTYIAYRSKDLDTKLMYEQSPKDLILNFKKFKQSTSQRIIVICLTISALAIGFIPTIMSKVTVGGNIYYDQVEVPLNKFDSFIVNNNSNWLSNLPPLDNFLPYLQSPNSTSIDDMYRKYLATNLNQQTAANPSGIWLNSKHGLTYNYNNQQTAGLEDFFLYENTTRTIETYSAFGYRAADAIQPSSSTIENCYPIEGVNNTVTLSPMYNLTVKAAHDYLTSCYPMYDPSVATFIVKDIPNLPSLLSASDTIYRSPQLTSGVTAVSSFGVSLFNHNSTHMTMGVKKMASITMYNYNQSMTLPLNCALPTIAAGKDFTSINFQAQPYDAVFCGLFSLSNTSYKVLQATNRTAQDNYAVNVVYTIQNGGSYEKGQSAMMDFNMFTAYTIEGQLADNNEVLVAYQTNSIGTVGQANTSFNATLANDNIGSILNKLDSSVIDATTVDLLVAMASARVRWSNGDLSDFTKVSASIINAVESPSWWVAVIVTLAILFIFPQLIIFVRPTHRFSEDLRTILISTLDKEEGRRSYWTGNGEESAARARHVNLMATSNKLQDGMEGEIVRLTIDGARITTIATKQAVDEKANSFSTIDETEISELNS